MSNDEEFEEGFTPVDVQADDPYGADVNSGQRAGFYDEAPAGDVDQAVTAVSDAGDSEDIEDADGRFDEDDADADSHSGEDDAPSRLQQLEEEGDIAADYLEDLLDIADLDGDIDIDVENDRASVAIVADDPRGLQRLIGADGRVLDALQELTRLAVQSETGERSRLMLDVAGFRAERKNQLRVITEEAIARLRATGEPQALEPMNPFERKVSHDVVAAAGLLSESEGAEPHRHVVIRFPEDEDTEDGFDDDDFEDQTHSVDDDVDSFRPERDGEQDDTQL